MMQLRKRGHHPDKLPSGDRLLNRILPPGQLHRFQSYERLRSEHTALDGTFMCDLDHWPHSPGPDYGPMFPCLLTHGIIIELSKRRFALPSEQFLSLGFRSVDSVSQRFSWPLAEHVLGQQERVSKAQSGNAQSLPVVLAWQLYVFCNTAKRVNPNPLDLVMPLADGEGPTVDEGFAPSNGSRLLS